MENVYLNLNKMYFNSYFYDIPQQEKRHFYSPLFEMQNHNYNDPVIGKPNHYLYKNQDSYFGSGSIVEIPWTSAGDFYDFFVGSVGISGEDDTVLYDTTNNMYVGVRQNNVIYDRGIVENKRKNYFDLSYFTEAFKTFFERQH